MTELRKQHLRTLLAVRAQLTPDQQQALTPFARGGECGAKGKGGHDHGPKED
jgi:hypothetical protein